MDIKQTISKLLSRTTSNGCTAQEALAAYQKAYELMAKHAISEEDLKDKKFERFDFGFGTKSTSKYQRIFVKEVSPHFGVETFLVGNLEFAVFGTTTKIEMFHTFVISGYNSCQFHWKKYYNTTSKTTVFDVASEGTRSSLVSFVVLPARLLSQRKGA